MGVKLGGAEAGRSRHLQEGDGVFSVSSARGKAEAARLTE